MTLRRSALVISYDGSSYPGWQTQSSGFAIQDIVTQAISEIASIPVGIVCAGRTDAGVHAIAQVVHVDLPPSRPRTAWTRGVNALLPPAIRITGAFDVDHAFHARFSAQQRSYRYLLHRGQFLPPLLHKRVGWTFRDLNLETFSQCAQKMVGEHDFSSFRSSQCQATSPVRTISEISIVEHGSLVVIVFRANAFLHHMIRNLMGAFVEVAVGRRDEAWFDEVFAAKDRTLSAPTFSPDGLYFLGPTYRSEDSPLELRRACEAASDEHGLYWV
jgi:tRNA pseudouridine38-40 synthase